MPEPHDHYANARNLAVDILRKVMRRTPELIRATAEKAVQAATIFAPDATIDRAASRKVFSSVKARTQERLNDIGRGKCELG